MNMRSRTDVIVFNEARLRRTLISFMAYYHDRCTHLGFGGARAWRVARRWRNGPARSGA
jgi:hypothetical protein